MARSLLSIMRDVRNVSHNIIIMMTAAIKVINVSIFACGLSTDHNKLRDVRFIFAACACDGLAQKKTMTLRYIALLVRVFRDFKIIIPHYIAIYFFAWVLEALHLKR